MTPVVDAASVNETRELTWLEEAMRVNPRQVFQLDPDNPLDLLVRPERNKRPTPPVGDKSLSDLIKSFEELGEDGKPAQLQPSRATLNSDGVADLYFGFRRARSIQTHNRGLAMDDPNRWMLEVIIDDREYTDAELTARTIAENAYRKDFTIMERTALIVDLMEQGMTGKKIATELNMSTGAVSTYARFNLFPEVAKRAMANDRMDYTAAARFLPLLPKKEELAADESGDVLVKAQERIAKAVTKLLSTGGTVKGNDADATTRNMEGEGGRAINNTQRKMKAVLSEIDAQVEVEEKGSAAAKRLEAFKKFVNGGTMKALVKALAS